jgi:hypothetical protein
MKDPHQLIRSYLDGELDLGGFEELQTWLKADAENQRIFLREVHLQRELRQFALGRRYQEEERGGSPQRDRAGGLSSGWRFGGWIRRFSPAWWGAAAALFVCAAVLWVLQFGRGPELVLIAEAGGTTVHRAGSAMPVIGRLSLVGGDRIETGGGARLEVASWTRLDLADQTALRVLSTGSNCRFEMTNGTVLAQVSRGKKEAFLVVVTPHAEARVSGTEFRLSADSQTTRLEVYQGTVRLGRMGAEEAVDVTAGFQARVESNQPIAMAELLPGKEGIEWEYWIELPGREIGDLLRDRRFPLQPSGSQTLERFETPAQWADHYGARLRGYLQPDRTGDYTFWIAADDEGELWLSESADPSRKKRICRTEVFTLPQQWDLNPSQKSAPVRLIGGRKYYIEALHKEGGGGDCLSVAWEGPGRAREVIGEGHLLTLPQNR